MLAEMVWITADQSQSYVDFGPVGMLTIWLLVLRASYIPGSYYEVYSVVLVMLYHGE